MLVFECRGNVNNLRSNFSVFFEFSPQTETKGCVFGCCVKGCDSFDHLISTRLVDFYILYRFDSKFINPENVLQIP